ncbi:MAG: hypothetical protein VCC68_02770 [Myxococcota bacterium]
MSKRSLSGVLSLIGLAAACATMQTGILPGKWLRDGKTTIPITMGWESISHSHQMGDMIVTFPSGEKYRGAFVRISSGVKVAYTTSVYNAWNMAGAWPMGVGYGYYGESMGWGGWDGDMGDGIYSDFAAFERNYTGKVVAGLSSQDGHALRCKFRVNDPQVGFISGGTGLCQVSIGGQIRLHF